MTLSKRSVGPSRQSRTSQSSQSAADPLLSARLATQESRISASCLKQSVSSTSSASHGTNKDSDRYEQQVEDDEDRKFFDTVAGVHCITKDRLYRAKSRSLESYFNTHWNISRAQVYRYVDCAYVLEHLAQFHHELPSRERLCRSLKKLAQSEQDLRVIWSKVLELSGDLRPIPTALVDRAWELLQSEGSLSVNNAQYSSSTPRVEPGKKDSSVRATSKTRSKKPLAGSKRGKGKTRKRKKEDYTSEEETEEYWLEEDMNSMNEDETMCEDDDIQDRRAGVFEYHERPATRSHPSFITPPRVGFQDSLPCSSLSQNFSGTLFQDHQLGLEDALSHPAPFPAAHPQSEVETLTSQLFSTLDALKARGYELQPMIQGEWYARAIADWRSVPSSWLLPSPSFSSNSTSLKKSTSTLKTEHTLKTPLLTSSPDIPGLQSPELRDAPTSLGEPRTLSNHKRTRSEIEQAARDLCLLTGTPTGLSS